VITTYVVLALSNLAAGNMPVSREFVCDMKVQYAVISNASAL
jgi:hypothetical protein